MKKKSKKNLNFFEKKGLSGSCYMGQFIRIFIFRVPESCSSDNILVRPLRWDVRTVEFMKISLKLSFPAQFP